MPKNPMCTEDTHHQARAHKFLLKTLEIRVDGLDFKLVQAHATVTRLLEGFSNL